MTILLDVKLRKRLIGSCLLQCKNVTDVNFCINKVKHNSAVLLPTSYPSAKAWQFVTTSDQTKY